MSFPGALGGAVPVLPVLPLVVIEPPVDLQQQTQAAMAFKKDVFSRQLSGHSAYDVHTMIYIYIYIHTSDIGPLSPPCLFQSGLQRAKVPESLRTRRSL